MESAFVRILVAAAVGVLVFSIECFVMGAGCAIADTSTSLWYLAPMITLAAAASFAVYPATGRWL